MLNQAARFPSSSETFLGQNQIPPASTNLPAKRKRTEGSFPSSNSNCAELNPSFGTEMRNGLLSFGHNLGSKVFYAVNSDPNCKIFYEIEVFIWQIFLFSPSFLTFHWHIFILNPDSSSESRLFPVKHPSI
eukprot:Sdes_comp18583_c0_seq2m8709